MYGNAVETAMTGEHPFNNRMSYGAHQDRGKQMSRALPYRYGLDHVGLRYCAT
jgi:hypothetical protein